MSCCDSCRAEGRLWRKNGVMATDIPCNMVCFVVSETEIRKNGRIKKRHRQPQLPMALGFRNRISDCIQIAFDALFGSLFKLMRI